jgi:hypothetical protein
MSPLVSIKALPEVWKTFEQLAPGVQLALSEGFLHLPA